jgi:3-oxoacyl-[acyl-carrier protein] reductase
MSTRIILVTGANGEMGCAITRAFLDESPDNLIYLGVHNRRERAELCAAGALGRCRVLSLEVCDPASWKKAVAAILSAHARLDVLVNNAGAHSDCLLGMMTPDSWRQVLAVNLDGVFHGCQAVLPPMVSQRAGRIINIASLSALLAPAGQTNYAAAKAGVLAFTQSLAKEVARLGITVNAVCPGYIETEAIAGMNDTARKQALQSVPMRRFGRPEEVAATVRFLACADAGYLTGSAIKIDGGIL